MLSAGHKATRHSGSDLRLPRTKKNETERIAVSVPFGLDLSPKSIECTSGRVAFNFLPNAQRLTGAPVRKRPSVSTPPIGVVQLEGLKGQ